MASWTQLERLLGFDDRISLFDSASADDYNTAKDSIIELAGNGVDPPDKTIQENADDVITLESDMSTLESDVSTLESDVSTIISLPVSWCFFMSIPIMAMSPTISSQFCSSVTRIPGSS